MSGLADRFITHFVLELLVVSVLLLLETGVLRVVVVVVVVVDCSLPRKCLFYPLMDFGKTIEFCGNCTCGINLAICCVLESSCLFNVPEYAYEFIFSLFVGSLGMVL